MNRPLVSVICGFIQIFGLLLIIVSIFYQKQNTIYFLLLSIVFGLAPIIKLFDQNTRNHPIGIPAALAGIGTIVIASFNFLFTVG